jgi:hypothetical protein
MILQFFIRKAVAACALTALLTTTSMVALAAPGRVAAELTVSGGIVNGEAPVVYVNGEASKSGRSVFSSSTVATPEEVTAVLGIAKTGRLELAPNSSVSLVFDDKTIDAELSSGTLTVLGASGTVNVRTNDGKTMVLNPGESISAEGATSARQQTSSKDKTWIWLLVAGGAAAAIIIAVSASGNGDDSVVSPNR